jgi:hypothetical protein
VKRIKVALDANVPPRVVDMLAAGYTDQGFEFYWEPQFAAADAPDEFWAEAFRRFGGRIVISGDKDIARKPHQMMAFIESGMTSFFCQSRWSSMSFGFKAAHLAYWWPKIAEHIERDGRPSCWWIPLNTSGNALKAAELPKGVKATARKFGGGA